MDIRIDSSTAWEYLQALVNQPLQYGIKSPDMDLYDFGFGEIVESFDYDGLKRKLPVYILHAICRFKVIWRNGQHRVDTYYEDTDYKEFAAKVKELIGLKVKRADLSNKNDLWLDLGDCWVVFGTHENEKESWRFFCSTDKEKPHLVASDAWLEFN